MATEQDAPGDEERRIAPDRRGETRELINQLHSALRYMVDNGTTREAYRLAEKAFRRIKS